MTCWCQAAPADGAAAVQPCRVIIRSIFIARLLPLLHLPAVAIAQDRGQPLHSITDSLADHARLYPHLVSRVKIIQAFLNEEWEGVPFDLVSGTVMVPWHEAPELYAVSQRRHGRPQSEQSGRNHRVPNVTAFDGNAPHDQYLLIGPQFPLGEKNEDNGPHCMDIQNLWDNDFAGLKPENIYGVVFHARDYTSGTVPQQEAQGNRANINLWLETLSGFNADNSAGKRKTMRVIMEGVVFPTDYFYAGFPGDGFCDALEACGASGMGGSCTLSALKMANPYDNDFDGTKSHWGMLTHTSPLDCGLNDGEGDNLDASATGHRPPSATPAARIKPRGDLSPTTCSRAPRKRCRAARREEQPFSSNPIMRPSSTT